MKKAVHFAFFIAVYGVSIFYFFVILEFLNVSGFGCFWIWMYRQGITRCWAQASYSPS